MADEVNANGRAVAPAVLQPQLSTDVVGFNIQNNQPNALASGIITFQETFLPGEVTTTLALFDRWWAKDSRSNGCQDHQRRRVGPLALLTFQQPSITANSSLSFMLSTAGTALTTARSSLANINDSNYNLKIAIALQGGSTVVLDAATLLPPGLKSVDLFLTGKPGTLAAQVRVDVPIAPLAARHACMTMYASGARRRMASSITTTPCNPRGHCCLQCRHSTKWQHGAAAKQYHRVPVSDLARRRQHQWTIAGQCRSGHQLS